jgi:hypothetical protein
MEEYFDSFSAAVGSGDERQTLGMPLGARLTVLQKPIVDYHVGMSNDILERRCGYA